MLLVLCPDVTTSDPPAEYGSCDDQTRACGYHCDPHGNVDHAVRLGGERKAKLIANEYADEPERHECMDQGIGKLLEMYWAKGNWRVLRLGAEEAA